eukprot:Nk52_evm37s288 gene=Nk52_evmTU37s288
MWLIDFLHNFRLNSVSKDIQYADRVMNLFLIFSYLTVVVFTVCNIFMCVALPLVDDDIYDSVWEWVVSYIFRFQGIMVAIYMVYAVKKGIKTRNMYFFYTFVLLLLWIIGYTIIQTAQFLSSESSDFFVVLIEVLLGISFISYTSSFIICCVLLWKIRPLLEWELFKHYGTDKILKDGARRYMLFDVSFYVNLCIAFGITAYIILNVVQFESVADEIMIAVVCPAVLVYWICGWLIKKGRSHRFFFATYIAMQLTIAIVAVAQIIRIITGDQYDDDIFSRPFHHHPPTPTPTSALPPPPAPTPSGAPTNGTTSTDSSVSPEALNAVYLDAWFIILSVGSIYSTCILMFMNREVFVKVQEDYNTASFGQSYSQSSCDTEMRELQTQSEAANSDMRSSISAERHSSTALSGLSGGTVIVSASPGSENGSHNQRQQNRESDFSHITNYRAGKEEKLPTRSLNLISNEDRAFVCTKLPKDLRKELAR